MVCGSRFITDTGYPAPISRRTGSTSSPSCCRGSSASRSATRPRASGSTTAAGIALFARDYPHDYPEVEAVLMVHHHRLRMIEVPVKMRERGGGISSITSGKSAYYMIKVLLALFVGLARRRPVPEPGDEGPVAAGHGI